MAFIRTSPMKRVSDLLVLTGGRLFQIIILLITTRVITSMLSPDQIGRFSIVYTIAALFIALFVNGVSLYTERKLLEWNLEGNILYHARRFFYYLFLSGVVASILVLLLKDIIGINISSLWLMILIFSLVFVANLNGCFISWLNIFKKRLWFVITSNLTLLTGLLISVFLVLSFSKTAEYWISGQILGQILLIAVGGFLFFRTAKPSPGEINPSLNFESSMSTIFHFVWPLSIASLVLWLQTQSYRFVLKGLTSLEVLGFFTVGFNLGSRLVERFAVLFTNFYNPIFYEEIAKADLRKKAQAWNRYAQAFFPAIILLGLFISSGGPFIAKIFVAKEFQQIAGNVILWGGLTSLVLALISTYGMVGVAQLQMKGLILPYSLGATVALGGIVILSRWNPYIGAGLSLLSGALATLAYLMVKMHKLLPVRFPKKHVGLSIIYSLPLVILLLVFRIIVPHFTLWQSLVILGILGFYLLLVQLIMARDWLFEETKDSFIEKLGKKLRFIRKT